MSSEGRHSSIPEDAELRRRLRRSHRRLALFHLTRGIGWLVICLAGLALVDLGLDVWLDLSGPARLLLLAANLAVLGWVVVRVLLPNLRRYDDLRTALRVESAHPDMNSLLVSAVQFGEGRLTPAGSDRLARLVRKQAARRAEGIELRRIADFSRIRRVIAGAIVAFVVLTGGLVWQPGYALTLARRMANPFSRAGYPTNTIIRSATGDKTVRQNESLLVEAVLDPGGQTPAEGTLWVDMGVGWEPVPLQSRGEHRFTHLFQQVYRDFRFYFEIGDAASRRADVRVVTPPRAIEAKVVLYHPEYTGLGSPETRSTLNLKVPEGTRVRWEFQLDKPVRQPVLNIEGQEPLRPVEEGETRLVFETQARASAGYALEYDWTLEGRDLSEQGPQHFLRVVRDNPPSVVLTYPMRDLKATLQKKAIIEFRATDDYGLGKAWLVYALNDGGEQRVEIGDLAGQQSAQQEMTWDVQGAIDDLREGDIITLAVEVTDGRPAEEAAVGRSRSRRMQFVSEADYLADILARRRNELGRIRPLYRHEMEASGKMGDLVSRLAGGEGEE